MNVLAMDYVNDSISVGNMRLEIQQTMPKDLNEPVKVTIEFDRAERRRRGTKYVR